MYRIEIIPLGEIEANCLLVSEGSDAVVVDPGAEPERLLSLVRQRNLTVRAILLTHGHYDHVGAVAETAPVWNCPVHLHEADHGLYKMQEMMIREYSGGSLHHPVLPFERTDYTFGGLSFRIHHTPGHSEGSVCIEPFDGGQVLLTGDTLFQGSVGRTDIPGANPRSLKASLKQLVHSFPEYSIIPGHGPASTMIEEIRDNYFLKEYRG